MESAIDVEQSVLPLDSITWVVLQVLAKDHGWEPRGTIGPAGIRLDTAPADPVVASYNPIEGALVESDDAESFADALERALAGPVFRNERHKVVKRCPLEEGYTACSEVSLPASRLLARPADEGNPWMRPVTFALSHPLLRPGATFTYEEFLGHVIEFLRGGSFRIW